MICSQICVGESSEVFGSLRIPGCHPQVFWILIPRQELSLHKLLRFPGDLVMIKCWTEKICCRVMSSGSWRNMFARDWQLMWWQSHQHGLQTLAPSGPFQTTTTLLLIPSSPSLPLSIIPILFGLTDPYCCRNLVLGFERDTCDSSHSLMSWFVWVTYCFSPLPCILSHFFFPLRIASVLRSTFCAPGSATCGLI